MKTQDWSDKISKIVLQLTPSNIQTSKAIKDRDTARKNMGTFDIDAS